MNDGDFVKVFCYVNPRKFIMAIYKNDGESLPYLLLADGDTWRADNFRMEKYMGNSLCTG
jgi:hypothetical protein